jgi:hypothetical protein
MEATARVIPWNVKERSVAAAAANGMEFGALHGVLIMLPDEQLEAFGKIFCSSPLRRAMTFEGYLIAKGFGQGLSEEIASSRGSSA